MQGTRVSVHDSLLSQNNSMSLEIEVFLELPLHFRQLRTHTHTYEQADIGQSLLHITKRITRIVLKQFRFETVQ